MAMPFVSNEKHRIRYTIPLDLEERIAEIKILLDGIRALPISLPLKKRMLRQAVWEVAYATGNTQSAFLGRYRSASVVGKEGRKIQRDHVYTMQALMKELLGPSPNVDEIVGRAFCCVVTKEEHEKLGLVAAAIDGWDRYRAAGITVYDMVDETKVV